MTGVLLATLGASLGDKLTVFNATITDIGAAPYTGTATLTFNTNGKQQQTAHVTTTDTGSYVVPTSRATAYEVMLHKESGTTPAGSALDVWIACSTSPAWTLTTTGANKQGAFTAALRLAGTTTTLVTGTVGGITMEVEAT